MNGPALRTFSLAKRYGRIEALRGVSLEVPAGSVFAVIGPNGAGKTTLFNILAGFIRPSSGSAEILGRPAGDFRSLKGSLGMMPQDTSLPEAMRVADILGYYCKLQGFGRAEAVQEAGRVMRLCSIDAVARQKVRNLSHGFRKRLALSQAFIGNPRLLILDEPTSGLDPAGAREIRNLIRGLRGDRTILVSSHNLAEIEEMADGVAILRSGSVAAAGSMAQIKGSSREILVTLRNPPPPPEAVKGITSIEGVSGALAQGKLIRISLDPAAAMPEEMMARVLAFLASSRVEVESCSRGASLEDRFIEVTGRSFPPGGR